jgi:pimeloyl-ACP methyl ester carboxylesterase
VADLPGGWRLTLRAEDNVSLAAARREPSAEQAGAKGTRATAVLGHGHGNDRRLLAQLEPALTARGMRVIALDFRAHGESGGDRTTLGPAEARDVAAALDYAERLGEPVLYVGFSMGAAAYLLSGREAAAAVLDSPYASLRGALASRLEHMGLLPPLSAGPIGFVSRRLPVPIDEVRPVDAAAGLESPTLLLFAEHDEWVPPEAQEAYRSAACAPCTVEILKGATHGGHFTAEWVERVASFLDAALENAPGG